MKNLAAVMQEKYDARNRMILRHSSDTDLLGVERDLIQIHKTIARHRRNCSHCKPRAASMRFGQLPGTGPLAPFEIAS
jgi:hypothetical protein